MVCGDQRKHKKVPILGKMNFMKSFSAEVLQLLKTNLIVLFSYLTFVFNLFYVFEHFWHLCKQVKFVKFWLTLLHAPCLGTGSIKMSPCLCYFTIYSTGSLWHIVGIKMNPCLCYSTSLYTYTHTVPLGLGGSW